MQTQQCLDFDGKTFDPAMDGCRLRRQLNNVFIVMQDGIWRTLSEISAITTHPEASVSARLRDLRKPKFGGYTVNRRRRGHWMDGIYEYQVVKKEVKNV